MIKKIAYLGVIGLLISSIISCEKDFTEVGSTIIDNGAFKVNDTLLEISMTSENIDAVRADNISIGTLGEYWLGIYNNPNYKKIEASIVGQLGFIENPRTEQKSTSDDTDSIYVLDKVLLRIPYQSTKSSEKTSDGKPIFKLDSVLGNTSIATPLQVLRNETYLNSLNPTDPSKANEYLSNANYIGSENLTENANFTFIPKATDTMYVFDRTRIVNQVSETFKDTIKIINTTTKKAEKPFLVVPLNKTKMKNLFWDKFNDSEFSTKEAFDDYFRGLILKSEGSDGALVPLKLSGANNSPTVDFYFTITRLEKKEGQTNKVYKDTIKSSYSFSLSGVRNSIYKMTDNTSNQTGTVKIQGTAGRMSNIEILNGTQLQDLRTKKWLINDASLTFYVDQNTDKDTALVPQRLFLYKNISTTSGSTIPAQISDSYRESSFFGGQLENSDKKPEKYTIRITDYISEILKGNEPVSPLTLKVYNQTDAPVSNRTLDTIVKTYNWNPRGVTLLNNSAVNGDKKAVLKISYTEEK